MIRHFKNPISGGADSKTFTSRRAREGAGRAESRGGSSTGEGRPDAPDERSQGGSVRDSDHEHDRKQTQKQGESVGISATQTNVFLEFLNVF